jgi:hypothetical protein
MNDHIWVVIAAVAGTTSILLYITKEMIAPLIRWRRLKNPVEFFFNVTTKQFYDIGYLCQDNDEHITKDLVAPACMSELCVQLIAHIKVGFVQNYFVAGFQGDLDQKPEIDNYFLPFVRTGVQRKRPGIDTTHYVDHHGNYHIEDQRIRPRGSRATYGFEITTKKPGIYPMKIEISADGVESTHSLCLVVEERPNTQVRCFRHSECFVTPSRLPFVASELTL